MTASSATTFPSFTKKWLRRLSEHWSVASVFLIFAGTGFSMVSIYIYTLSIGRTDIFMLTLDSKSALLAWLMCVLFIMFLQFWVLMSCAWLFSTSVSFVARRRSVTRLLAVWLLIPVVVGIVSFIVVVFYFSDEMNISASLAIVTLATVLAFLAVSRFPKMQRLITVGAPRNAQKVVRFSIAFTLVLTVISGAIPLLLITESYVGKDDQEAVNFVAMYSSFVLVLSLVPVVLFHLLQGDVYRRVLIAALGVMFFFGGYLVTSRGAMSSITYIVAGKLKVRQMQVTRFVLDDQVRLEDLDPLQWHPKLRPDGRVQVDSYQLFNFGDTLLICPTVIRSVSLHVLPYYSKLCYLTLNSKVARMPPRLLIGAKAPSEIWNQMAGKLFDWQHVRVHLIPPQLPILALD